MKTLPVFSILQTIFINVLANAYCTLAENHLQSEIRNNSFKFSSLFFMKTFYGLSTELLLSRKRRGKTAIYLRKARMSLDVSTLQC